MLQRLAFLLPCVALGGCIPLVMPAPGSGGGAEPSSGGLSSSEAPPEQSGFGSSASQPSTESPKPSGPVIVSVTLRSSCKENVRVFFGDKPKYGSGTTSSISPNSVSSRQMKEGDMVWIVDASDNPLASVRIQESTSKIEVDGSCKSWR